MEVSNRNGESIPREIPVTVYSAEITNGYVFRQIFELYDKLVMEGIPIYFKESGITIRTGTSSSRDSMKLISDIEIYTDDIIEYYMNKDLATIRHPKKIQPVISKNSILTQSNLFLSQSLSLIVSEFIKLLFLTMFLLKSKV